MGGGVGLVSKIESISFSSARVMSASLHGRRGVTCGAALTRRGGHRGTRGGGGVTCFTSGITVASGSVLTLNTALVFLSALTQQCYIREAQHADAFPGKLKGNNYMK